jgi:glycosyltransferase involved in cell wall biosynthesis
MGVLRNKIEEWGIDLIHCHLPWSGILGRFLGKQLDIPTLYTEHNLSKRYHFLTRLMNNLTIDMNSKVLAVSKDVFSDLLQNISMAKVKQLNNGVNTDKFDPDLFNKDEVRGELRIPLDSIVIGNIAVFRTQKRLDLWLTIASKLCELNTSIIFILIGDGQLKESLVKLTHRLTLCDKVIFTGSKADVRPYLAAMDIFMMTSEFEGLPIALLEAVSMKKAVAVTNAGGNKEVIENEVNGLICEVDDLDQLYMNMLRLIEDNELRLRLGTEARNTAIQKFSIHRMIKELEEAYLEQLYERS